VHYYFNFFQLRFPQHAVFGIEPEPFIFVQFVRDVEAIYFFQDGIYSLDKTER
jgi:hypothetical protein